MPGGILPNLDGFDRRPVVGKVVGILRASLKADLATDAVVEGDDDANLDALVSVTVAGEGFDRPGCEDMLGIGGPARALTIAVCGVLGRHADRVAS